MTLARRLQALAILVFLSAPLHAQSLPQLFQTGKEQFRKSDYRNSLETFSRLDELSQKPGMEADRTKLEGVIMFYRGANLAAG